MQMLYGGGLFALVVFALWIYCIFDVISTDEALARNLPKIMWLLIVIFVPTVGSIAWLILGRPQEAGFAPGDTTRRGMTSGRSSHRALGPDDDPHFLSELDDRRRKLQNWEEDLKKREEELKRRDEDES
jgi:hypothetical protein